MKLYISTGVSEAKSNVKSDGKQNIKFSYNNYKYCQTLSIISRLTNLDFCSIV